MYNQIFIRVFINLILGKLITQRLDKIFIICMDIQRQSNVIIYINTIKFENF